jgi:hypothetical protein
MARRGGTDALLNISNGVSELVFESANALSLASAVVIDDKGRKGTDLGSLGCFRDLVDVDLHEHGVGTEFSGEILELWGENHARATPVGKVVYNDGLVLDSLEHLLDLLEGNGVDNFARH